MTYQTPPEGWFPFGYFIEVPVRLEFSDETGDDGMPLWERPLFSEDRP